MDGEARPAVRRVVRARRGLLRRLPRAGRRRPAPRDPPTRRRLHDRDLPVAHEPSRAHVRLEPGRRDRRRVPGVRHRDRPRLRGGGPAGRAPGSAPAALAVAADRLLPRRPRAADRRSVLRDRFGGRRTAVGPHGRAHGHVGARRAAARRGRAGTTRVLCARAGRAAPAGASAPFPRRVDAHTAGRVGRRVLGGPAGHPPPGRVRPGAVERLRTRGRARAVPDGRTTRVGPAPRRRPVPAPVPAPGPVRAACSRAWCRCFWSPCGWGRPGMSCTRHYLGEQGASAALHDQGVAATIMWAGGLPAFLVPALAAVAVGRPVRGRGGRAGGAAGVVDRRGACGPVPRRAGPPASEGCSRRGARGARGASAAAARSPPAHGPAATSARCSCSPTYRRSTVR